MGELHENGLGNEKPTPYWEYVRSVVVSLVNKDKNRCILDLGCGNGYFVKYLLSQGYNVYGVDSSEEGIAIAKKTNPDRFFLQDLSKNKLPKEIRHMKFDTIISTELIEHLYNPFSFVNLCRDILQDSKGELILSTPYHGYFKNLMLSVFNKWDKHTNPVAVGGHIKFWSKGTLSRLLTEGGFLVTDFKGCGRMPYFWKSMVIKARVE